MITSLRLQNFRSHGDESFEFDPGVNIIVGPNASGKTNLLEAVLVVARGGSYRALDGELVAFDKPWARLDALLPAGLERIVKIVSRNEAARPAKSFDLSGKPLRRLALEQQLPVVLFEPSHLQLLAGPPDGRRGYLDNLLEQTTPGYDQLRRQYARCLRQRNSLLKSGGHPDQLFPWDVRLSQLGAQIARARHQLVNKLNDLAPALYQKISGDQTQINLSYQTKFNPDKYETQLLHKLSSGHQLDLARGFTGNGPHREDLLAEFDGRPASASASRGETRTLLLTLKILELQLLAELRGQAPLLLLDDVFSELDGARRHALTEYLKDYQTFITTTDADIVQKNFTRRARILPLGS